MRIHSGSAAVCLAILATLNGPNAAADEPASEPAVFRDLSPRAARDLAADEGRILIIRWTATWCGPCKRMDKTTWPDAQVVKWVDDHAIAISADLDAMRRGAEIQKVNAVPTMIAFKGSTEFDRVVGYRTPDQLLEWFSSLESGATADDRLNAEIASLPTDGGEEEVDARYELAGRLAEGGRLEAAADQYIWLWNNIPNMDTGYDGVRVSFMAGEMERLAQQSPECRARFVSLRDALTPKITPGPAFDEDALDDWIVLNRRVLGESRAVIEWAERTTVEAENTDGWRDPFGAVRRELIGLRRWDLAAKFAGDIRGRANAAIWMANQQRPVSDQFDEADRAELVASLARMNRERLAEFHTLALVRGLDEDARTIADEALEFDPSDDMRLAIVQSAMSARLVRPMHAEILEKCPSATEYLKKMVADAIAAGVTTTPASPQTPPAAPPPSP